MIRVTQASLERGLWGIGAIDVSTMELKPVAERRADRFSAVDVALTRGEPSRNTKIFSGINMLQCLLKRLAPHETVVRALGEERKTTNNYCDQ